MARTEYRLIARNPATASENRIHADDVAQRYGFLGGLVPGVTMYAYVVHALVDAFGPDWVERGNAAVRFRSPCYEGDSVVIEVAEDGAISARVADTVCVTGWAGLAGGGAVPAVPAATAPARASRPAASADELRAGRVLGSIGLHTDPAYLAKVDEPSSLYASRGWLHPAELLEGANGVLMANVVLPAWLHVESEMHHLRSVRLGEEVDVRARVAAQWERKGHQFVTLEVAWVAASSAVAWARHTAIWQLAG